MKRFVNPLTVCGIGFALMMCTAVFGRVVLNHDSLKAAMFHLAAPTAVGVITIIGSLIWFVVRVALQMNLTGVSVSAAATDQLGTEQVARSRH